MKRHLIILTTIILIAVGLFTIELKPARVVIGYFAGECVGNCWAIYEVTTKVLRVDTTSFLQSGDNLQIKGQRFFEQDDEGDFDSFKLNIPLIMLIDPRTIFGCPDCLDQGGYYLEFTTFGIRRHFKIERDEEPFYFSSLTVDIAVKIDEIERELKKYGR